MNFKKFNFKKITSTNEKAINLLKKGYKRGIVIADFQSKGRGQYGKKWISIKGNLLMSIFFQIKKKISIKRLNKINLELVKKVLQTFSNKKIKIKYPNDLFIDKKKFCGILQETIFVKNNKFLVLGIGVNINDSPKIPHYPTTFLNLYSSKKISKFVISKYIKRAYEINNIVF
tara:strand:+ start:566 stop:1084 length:519 start_codon:yes stop_codon:yes gene_type:complete